MKIEFDPAKDAANIAKHGLSLAEASTMDLTTAAVVGMVAMPMARIATWRFNRIEGQPHCLVFTLRDDVVRVISFRRAHEKEISRYGR